GAPRSAGAPGSGAGSRECPSASPFFPTAPPAPVFPVLGSSQNRCPIGEADSTGPARGPETTATVCHTGRGVSFQLAGRFGKLETCPTSARFWHLVGRICPRGKRPGKRRRRQGRSPSRSAPGRHEVCSETRRPYFPRRLSLL